MDEAPGSNAPSSRESLDARSAGEPASDRDRAAGINRLRTNGALALASRILMAGGKTGVFILVARQLGAEGQGAFALSLAVAIVISTVSSFGLETANVYFVGKDRSTLSVLLTHSLVFSLVLTVVGSVAAGGIAVLVPGSFLEGRSLVVVLAVASVTVGQLLFNLLTALCTGLGEFRTLVNAYGVRYLGAFLLVLGLTGRLTLETALIAWLIPLVAALGYLFIRLWLRDRSGFRVRPGLLREQFAFGVKSHIDKAATLLTYRLDLFLVAGLAGTTAAGLYSVAQQSAEVLLMVARGTSQALLSEKVRGVGKSVSVRWLYGATIAILIVFMVPLAVFAGWLLPAFFGAEFSASVAAHRMLLPGVFAMTIGILTASHLIGVGRPGATAFAGATALVVTVVLDLILIPRLGIFGAAVASTCAYTAYAAVAIVFLQATRRGKRKAMLIEPPALNSSAAV